MILFIDIIKVLGTRDNEIKVLGTRDNELGSGDGGGRWTKLIIRWQGGMWH